VKPHPNTERKYKIELTRTKVRLLEHFPPIYPLLDRTDAYIGDMSSIGYDFLAYERPLFFLTKEKADPLSNPSAFLMRCGQQVLIKDIPFFNPHVVQDSHLKQALFAHTFDASLLTDWRKDENGANV
jgi:CDP-glycerol glycerophosphotransferase (TagB/SpsB family)